MGSPDVQQNQIRDSLPPKGLTDEIDMLIEELGFWPSRGAFVREATLEKVRAEQDRLLEMRGIRDSKREVD